MLEALACGTPAVLPRCAVFDELWAEKLPGDWRYEAHGEEPKRAVAIAEALACASCEKARVRMASNPVKASWADATNELLSQYEAAIEGNLPYRQELATITKIVNQARARPAPPRVPPPLVTPHLTPHRSPGQMIRATLLAFLMWWLLKTYSVRTYQFFSKVVFEAVFGDFEVFG